MKTMALIEVAWLLLFDSISGCFSNSDNLGCREARNVQVGYHCVTVRGIVQVR